jgi:hypothetical protein
MHLKKSTTEACVNFSWVLGEDRASRKVEARMELDGTHGKLRRPLW